METQIDQIFTVAGTAQHYLESFRKAAVSTGDELTLSPEPTNPHDPNAIRILKEGTQIGYVPRVYCTAILLAMSNKLNLVAKVTDVWSKGCCVRVIGSK